MKVHNSHFIIAHPGNPLDVDTVELRDVKYELHRLFTDPVRGEMVHRKQATIQSMMNLITILKRNDASATSSIMGQATALKANANSVTVMGVDLF